MSDAVAHTLDGCEVQPLGEELNPEKEELLVDMEALKEKGLDIINTTAYIAITGDFILAPIYHFSTHLLFSMFIFSDAIATRNGINKLVKCHFGSSNAQFCALPCPDNLLIQC